MLRLIGIAVSIGLADSLNVGHAAAWVLDIMLCAVVAVWAARAAAGPAPSGASSAAGEGGAGV